MAGATSLEAVKRKIKFLQEQADDAEERTERLQTELIKEKKTREQVSIFIARQATQELHVQNCLYLPPSSCSLFSVMYVPFVKKLELMHVETAGFLLMDRSAAG